MFFKTDARLDVRPVAAVVTDPVGGRTFRGWFARSAEWEQTDWLADPVPAGTALVVFAEPIGCDVASSASLRLRNGRLALGLSGRVERTGCVAPHTVVAAFAVDAAAVPPAGVATDPPSSAYGPAGDPAVFVAAAPGPDARAEIADLADLDRFLAGQPDLLAGVRDTVAQRVRPGTRVLAYLLGACDGVRPVLLVEPRDARVALTGGPCPAPSRHLVVFAVPA
jgi:hypothetical protein